LKKATPFEKGCLIAVIFTVGIFGLIIFTMFLHREKLAHHIYEKSVVQLHGYLRDALQPEKVNKYTRPYTRSPYRLLFKPTPEDKKMLKEVFKKLELAVSEKRFYPARLSLALARFHTAMDDRQFTRAEFNEILALAREAIKEKEEEK
jgi:hypothetical protein